MWSHTASDYDGYDAEYNAENVVQHTIAKNVVVKDFSSRRHWMQRDRERERERRADKDGRIDGVLLFFYPSRENELLYFNKLSTNREIGRDNSHQLLEMVLLLSVCVCV